ncbi:MAG: aminoacyl-tRNA hydrolase [Candidatus Hydrogenedens sp.]|nr:aminoacyl-tRNA hydrolase [Candidatus Hydrogenedens sp.]
MIVGLGNPGPKYEFTRHNLGFLALDTLAAKLNTAFGREKHEGLMAEAAYRGEKLLLVKPQTFMNLSGNCVAKAARNKVHEPADILVVVDEVNLPLGRLRFRAGGSAGGHNGLKSIIERLGTPEFHRMRMGVGNTGSGAGLVEHVLAKFRPDEFETVAEMRERGAEGILTWVSEGLETAMNRFN